VNKCLILKLSLLYIKYDVSINWIKPALMELVLYFMILPNQNRPCPVVRGDARLRSSEWEGVLYLQVLQCSSQWNAWRRGFKSREWNTCPQCWAKAINGVLISLSECRNLGEEPWWAIKAHHHSKDERYNSQNCRTLTCVVRFWLLRYWTVFNGLSPKKNIFKLIYF
jgi:hypothetical protein